LSEGLGLPSPPPPPPTPHILDKAAIAQEHPTNISTIGRGIKWISFDLSKVASVFVLFDFYQVYASLAAYQLAKANKITECHSQLSRLARLLGLCPNFMTLEAIRVLS